MPDARRHLSPASPHLPFGALALGETLRSRPDRAIIAVEKLTACLLNPSHKHGGAKARL